MPPRTDHRLYNSRAIVVYLRLLQKAYPQVAIPAILDYSGIKNYQVDDPGHWFSQEQVDRFYEKLFEVCKNPDIAREAGRYAVSVESLGPFGQYLLCMLGPSNAFSFISKIAPRLTRSASYNSRRIGPRKVEVDVRPHVGVEEKEFQCANRLGWFEAVVHMFNFKMEKIEHPECLFRGDATCRYVVSWKKYPTGLCKKLRNLGLLSFPLLFTFSMVLPFTPTLHLLLGGGLIVSILALLAEIEANVQLKNQVNQIRNDTEKALNKISTNHDNAVLTDEIARAISQETKVESILERVVNLISKRMEFDRVMVFLPNLEQTRLELHAEYGLAEDARTLLQDLSIPIDPSHRERLITKVFFKQEPVLVENPGEMKEVFSPEGYQLIEQLRGESFVCCPIVCNGTTLGILAADKEARNVPLVQTDLSLMEGVAAYIGIALRNADLLEGMESQLKKIQEKDAELLRYRESLEDQVKTRTMQLREAVRAAEAANSAKSEFLANMSHEIRTPMTAFMVAIDYLLQKDTDPERHRILEMADQSAQRLLALIDNILDLSRIEAGGMAVEEREFDLRSCLGEVLDLFLLSAQEKNLQLETEIATDVPNRVLGDSDKLAQVLINLVGNALKFTPEGKVNISLRTLDGLLEFTVADTGIGIPKEKQHLIFLSFSQTDNSFHRQYGGSGLGLAISKELVEMMGGELSYRSQDEKGSIFTFTLPLRTLETTHEPVAVLTKDPEKIVAARILLAEDESIIREMMMMLLAQRGWEIEIAETGREAVEKWKRCAFDLIFMDLQMPEMNGIEATLNIRKRESETAKRTCIIGLTAHARREIVDDCLSAGMDRVLTKPVQMKDLYAAVDALS